MNKRNKFDEKIREFFIELKKKQDGVFYGNEELSKKTFEEVQNMLNTDINKFSVGDKMFVPIDGYKLPVSFEVVHREDGNVYFMAERILDYSTPEHIDECLDGFMRKLPEAFTKLLEPIEHVNADGAYAKLISLPSERNLGGTENLCNGKDDIVFDMFANNTEKMSKTDINDNLQKASYYTDTPYYRDKTKDKKYEFLAFGEERNKWYTIIYGEGIVCSYGGYPDKIKFGVCPIFKLTKE